MIITFFERFVASKTVGVYIPAGTITFDDKPVDNTNSFDETKGSFEAPIEGTYVFFVNAHVGQGMASAIGVYVNGAHVKDFYDSEDAGNAREMNFFLKVVLKKSDILYLNNYYAETIFVDSIRPLTFLGYLM